MKTFLRTMIVLNLASAVVNALLGNVMLAAVNNTVALFLIWTD